MNQAQITIKKAIHNKYKNGTGSKNILIDYEGKEYKYTYNYGSGYGFAFVKDGYSSEIIYSTTQPFLNTEIGSKIEFSIMKMSPIKYEEVTQ